MEMAVWILFCFFASIGLAQCGVWLREALISPPRKRPGWYVVPLYDDEENLEFRVREAVLFARAEVCRNVLLVDMGLGEECAEICERLLLDAAGVYICGVSELGDALRRIDAPQDYPDMMEEA